MASPCSRSAHTPSRGNTLIGTLASVCIIMLLVLVSMGWWSSILDRGSKTEESIPKRVTDRAHDVECLSRLQSLRSSAAAGGILGDPTEAAPPSRSEIGSDADLRCPLCGLPYRYDPSQYGNGKYGLSCRYPKHQRL